MNCIAVIPPKKNTVGTANPWTANQRKVKMGYATGWLIFFAIVFSFNL